MYIYCNTNNGKLLLPMTAEILRNIVKINQKLIRFLFISFLFLLIPNFHIGAEESSQYSVPKQVLIIHSGYQGYPWTDSLNSGINSIFNSQSLPVNLMFEYIDTKRNITTSYLDKLHELWDIKYKNQHIDLVMVCDTEAFDFVLQDRTGVFQEIPVVFVAYIGFSPDTLTNKQPLTGVIQETDIIETINTALLLHPQTEKVVFIAPGAPLFRMVWLEGLDEIFSDRVQIVKITSNNISQIDEEIDSLGENIVVIPLNSVLGTDGIYIPFQQFVSHLSVKRPFPVYALWDIALGQGVVGGKMVTGKSQGMMASKLALQILNGTPIAEVPVVLESPNQYMFDWEVLQRFKIHEKDLPEGSIIINKSKSFYSENKAIVHISIIVFLCLILLIFSLIFSMLHLRSSQENLKKSDKIVKQSEAQFKKMIQRSPLPMVIINQDQSVNLFNDKFIELFGYTTKDITTAEEWWSNAYPDEKYREIVQNSWAVGIKEARVNGTEIEMQEWLLTIKNGTQRLCNFYMVPLEGISLIIMNDITESRKTENKLRESEDKFRALFELSPVGMAMIDHETGVFLEVNNAVLKPSGYTKEEFIALDFWTITPKRYNKQEADQIEELNKTGRFGPKEKEYIRKDGTRYPIRISGFLITNTNGVKVVWGIIEDLSERKHSEEEKQKLQQQLNQKNKMDTIGELAGGMAHDFNNVLCGIMGASELLSLPQSGLNEKNLKFVDMITQASVRASDLISKLLTFSRKGKIVKSTLNINMILKDVVEILEGTIDKNITISVEEYTTNNKFIGDLSSIENTLLNLGINASHAMPNGGLLKMKTINISLDQKYCDSSVFEIKPGEFLQIEIIDTGCGITEDSLNKIFDPFYTTKEQGKGTGLGLSVAYGTIQDHNGSIEVNSEVGLGTTFSILLPCSEELINKVDKIKPILTGTGTILLVDDEESNRVLIQEILESLGYKVLLAEDGLKSVEIFSKNHSEIDIVLLDMIMPKMNGSQAFKQMKKIDNNCKVIISSGYAKDQNLDELIKLGLAGFINKPYKISQISHLLNKIQNE